MGDIEWPLTDACSNGLRTAEGEWDYEVSCGIDGTMCLIEVVDRGVGFDPHAKGLSEAVPTAENGRGIQLMRALVDNVRFENRPEDGTVVHLEKQLLLHEDAVLSRLDVVATKNGPWTHTDKREGADAPR